VTVDGLDVPTCGLEPGVLVGDAGDIDGAVDGDVVVVKEHAKVRQLLHASKANRLMADAFHQAAVASDDVGHVIDDALAVAGALNLFSNRETYGVGDALTKRASRRLNPRRVAVFWVPIGDGTPLAEVFDLLQRHLRIASEIEQGIKQHRAVARRQNETVAVGPVRGLGVKAQVLFKKHRRHIRHADWHACVARVRGSDGIKRERADRGGFVPVVWVRRAKSGDVQGVSPFLQV